jgi:hypothetical protein
METAEHAAREARERLGQFERAAAQAREQTALERSAREAAECAVTEIRLQLGRERSARQSAERAVKESSCQRTEPEENRVTTSPC